MEQRTLINEAAQFINKASAAQGDNNELEACNHLNDLRCLLNDPANIKTDEEKENTQEGSET